MKCKNFEEYFKIVLFLSKCVQVSSTTGSSKQCVRIEMDMAHCCYSKSTLDISTGYQLMTKMHTISFWILFLLTVNGMTLTGRKGSALKEIVLQTSLPHPWLFSRNIKMPWTHFSSHIRTLGDIIYKENRRQFIYLFIYIFLLLLWLLASTATCFTNKCIGLCCQIH